MIKEDVTSLFSDSHIQTGSKIVVQLSQGVTYDVEPKSEDNWVFATFCGFKILKKKLQSEGQSCKHFITVGTGPGIDAIGAYYVLQPKFIRVSDINQQAAEIALYNLRANLSDNHSAVTAFSSGDSLDINLNDWDQQIDAPPIDLINANLPNIPANEVNACSVQAATYVNKSSLSKECPENLDKNLLNLQYRFLNQSRQILTPGGSAVIALGLRMPYKIVEELFAAAQLKLEELFTMFKIQTQPEEVIQGYATFEKKHGIPFIFYNYDEVERSGFLNSSLNGKQMQERLKPLSLSAQQAMIAYKEGERIGHIVSILRGVK